MPWYGWLILGVLFAAGIAVAQWRGWIELRGNARGHSTGAGAFGALDEVFAPTRHEAQRELEQQSELPAPLRSRAIRRSTSMRGVCASESAHETPDAGRARAGRRA